MSRCRIASRRHRAWRRAAPLLICVLAGAPTALAWSPSPPSTSTPARTVQVQVQAQRPLSTTATSLASSTEAVDSVYYSASQGDALLAETSTSQELEAAAQKYGSTSDMSAVPPGAKVTLTRWLSAKVRDYPELRDMESLHLSIQMACKTISNLIHSSTTAKLSSTAAAMRSTGRVAEGGGGGAGGDMRDNSMKRLDQISKNVLQNALRFTGRLRVVEAPRTTGDNEEGPAAHQPGVTIAYALDQYGKDGTRRKVRGNSSDARWGKTRRLAACFDPLDGSGNADAAICTGTVFGVFDADAGFKGGEKPDLRDASSLSRAVLQPGNQLLAAGYCLYSSTTILVFTIGGGTHGFTLDQSIGEFVLTHPNMKIPERGNIYSCNEAYSEGWDERFKGYLKTLKTGTGWTGQRYTQRYIGSMVGDVHRTLMYGGLFASPPDSEVHPKGSLQLVYKSAPMAYILEHAGGKATNGKVDLLSVQPNYVHERSPCFMGSPEDMDELMAYLGGEEGEKRIVDELSD